MSDGDDIIMFHQHGTFVKWSLVTGEIVSTSTPVFDHNNYHVNLSAVVSSPLMIPL
jgi:hypothetical protein